VEKDIVKAMVLPLWLFSSIRTTSFMVGTTELYFFTHSHQSQLRCCVAEAPTIDVGRLSPAA
jgi:hypothetical protein